MKAFKIMKTLFIIIAILFLGQMGFAQKKNIITLEIGKPMPDFELGDVLYYNKNKVRLSDFKGKWLILDFWNRYCSVCLKSHPHMDSLQTKFHDQNVQIMLVGYTGSQFGRSDDKAIRELHEEQRSLKHLSLPIAYDSLLFHRLDIKPTPYIVVVDPNGIVQGTPRYVSEQNLRDLINGQKVDFVSARTETQLTQHYIEKRKLKEKDKGK